MIGPGGDGLYQVTTRYLCAGFVMEGGEVIACAPILWRRIEYWMRVATWLRPDPPVTRTPDAT